jgi:hypothetical protein
MFVRTLRKLNPDPVRYCSRFYRSSIDPSTKVLCYSHLVRSALFWAGYGGPVFRVLPRFPFSEFCVILTRLSEIWIGPGP